MDTDTVCALFDEAARLRPGLGKGGPWLRKHLAPGGTHHLVPDPADHYWPDPTGRTRWWQSTALLQMIDGAQVTGMLAVLPETFTALPSSVPRRQQRRLLHLARATERDTYLWGRDHASTCTPSTCGYIRTEPEDPSEPAPS
ncbi:hypothetical protein AB0L06_43215 [Spirillospora sp. NPDC052269]